MLFASRDYPLVNQQFAMENPHFSYIYIYQLFQWPFSSSQTVTNYQRVIPWFIMVFPTAGWWSHIPLYHHCTTIVPPLYLSYCTTIVPPLYLSYCTTSNIHKDHKPSSLGLFHFHFFSVASRSLRGSAASLPIAGLPGYATNNGYTMWGPQTIATLVYD